MLVDEIINTDFYINKLNMNSINNPINNPNYNDDFYGHFYDTEINKFIVDKTMIKTGINYPLIKVDDEIKSSSSWSLQAGSINIKMNTYDTYFNALAFARIIGYLITDGHISSERNVSHIYLGHMLDVTSVMEDIKLFCNSKQTNFVMKNLYRINIPAKFTKQLWAKYW